MHKILNGWHFLDALLFFQFLKNQQLLTYYPDRFSTDKIWIVFHSISKICLHFSFLQILQNFLIRPCLDLSGWAHQTFVNLTLHIPFYRMKCICSEIRMQNHIFQKIIMLLIIYPDMYCIKWKGQVCCNVHYFYISMDIFEFFFSNSILFA